MNGYKTLIAAFVAGPVSAWVVSHLGFELTPDQRNYLVAGIMTTVMTVMRFVTNGPVPWLAQRLHDERAKQVTEIVETILLKQTVNNVQSTKGDSNA